MSNYKTVFFTLGILQIILGLFMLIPLIIQIIYKEVDSGFISASIVCIIFGILFYLSNLDHEKKLNLPQAFLLTALSWLTIAIFGSLPFIFSNIELGLTDAISIGVDYVPMTIETPKNTSNDGENTKQDGSPSNVNHVEAHFEDLTTIYAKLNVPLGGTYVKIGYSHVDVISVENMSSGNSYGNDTSSGMTAGLGYNHEVAGGVSVTGTAQVTLTGEDNTNHGNGWSMTDSLSFSGSADLDNGWAVTYNQAIDGGAAAGNTDIVVNMGDMGTYTFVKQGSSGPVSSWDDKTPSANEESYATISLGSIKDVNLAVSAAKTAFSKWSQVETEKFQGERNLSSKKIGKLKSEGKEVGELLNQVASIGERLDKSKIELEKIQNELNDYYMNIPNIPDISVPPGDSEDDNVEIRKWGEAQRAS